MIGNSVYFAIKRRNYPLICVRSDLPGSVPPAKSQPVLFPVKIACRVVQLFCCCRLRKLAQCPPDLVQDFITIMDIVTFCQVRRVVIRQPGLTILVFPDQGFLRQVNRNALGTLHQWCSYFWIAEDKQFRGAQRFPDAGRALRVIDAGENSHTLCFKDAFKTIRRRAYIMSAS